MILFIYEEGGYWSKFTKGYWPKAIRVGNWVFDFILLKLGYNPIRKVADLPENYEPKIWFPGQQEVFDLERLKELLKDNKKKVPFLFKQ